MPALPERFSLRTFRKHVDPHTASTNPWILAPSTLDAGARLKCCTKRARGMGGFGRWSLLFSWGSCQQSEQLKASKPPHLQRSKQSASQNPEPEILSAVTNSAGNYGSGLAAHVQCHFAFCKPWVNPSALNTASWLLKPTHLTRNPKLEALGIKPLTLHPKASARALPSNLRGLSRVSEDLCIAAI